MRKRIFIAVVAVLGIGVGVYLVLQPEKGTVEYHERAISRITDRLNGTDWRSRCHLWVFQKSRVSVKFLARSKVEDRRLQEEMIEHYHAMLKLKQAELEALRK